jgi:nucleoside-diphosphate-sugar epimerase
MKVLITGGAGFIGSHLADRTVYRVRGGYSLERLLPVVSSRPCA